jgi:hypothetical protein
MKKRDVLRLGTVECSEEIGEGERLAGIGTSLVVSLSPHVHTAGGDVCLDGPTHRFILKPREAEVLATMLLQAARAMERP